MKFHFAALLAMAAAVFAAPEVLTDATFDAAIASGETYFVKVRRLRYNRYASKQALMLTG